MKNKKDGLTVGDLKKFIEENKLLDSTSIFVYHASIQDNSCADRIEIIKELVKYPNRKSYGDYIEEDVLYIS